MLIDFTEIPSDGEEWEAFGRDFLRELGFSIDSPPDRGADGGKDLLVLEQLAGRLGTYPLRWLVSCKHRAHSRKSVSEHDEPNLLERMKSFRADGFIGLYSTLPSAGLNSRLGALRDSREIRDYRIFDCGTIENYLIRVGYSNLVMRFFPRSYKTLRPLHQIVDEYIPLHCEVCGRDLLIGMFRKEYDGLVGYARSRCDRRQVVAIYWACKGDCDRTMEERFDRADCNVGWEDLSDLVIPSWYLKWVLATMNRLRAGDDIYSEEAFEREKELLMALAQKVLREMTAKEHERVTGLFEIEGF